MGWRQEKLQLQSLGWQCAVCGKIHNLSVLGSDKSSLVICVSGNSIENVKRIGGEVGEVNLAYNICNVVTLYIQTG